MRWRVRRRKNSAHFSVLSECLCCALRWEREKQVPPKYELGFGCYELEASLGHLDRGEIQPVHSEDQPWNFFGRNDAKAEIQYFGHLMRRVDSLEKTLMLGGIGGRRRRG